MTTPYSPGLKSLIELSRDRPDFAGNLVSVQTHNELVGIRNGDDIFLSRSYPMPRRSDMDRYVESLELTSAELTSYKQSRLQMFLHNDGDNTEATELTMRIIIALHLRFGEKIWNSSSFRPYNYRRYFEPVVADDLFLEWMLNDDGELTPFGVSVAVLRSDDWYSSMIVATTGNKGGVLIEELAFAVARERDCFNGIRVGYNNQRKLGRNYSKMIADIRSSVGDDSAVAWWLLWNKTSPERVTSWSGRDGEKDYLDAQERFLEIVRAIGREASYDSASRYIGTPIGNNPVAIIESARNDIDPALIDSLTEFEAVV